MMEPVYEPPTAPDVVVPNLFIVGAQKSGTTSLHTYLDAHPDIFMSATKEPGYFTPTESYYPKELAWYLDLFAEGRGARFVGESSTHYTKRPAMNGAEGRIAQFSPDARILYVMRDPIRRAISHYWHARSRMEEHRSILEAIREEPIYRHFGDYEMQLRPYLDTFGRDRVHALTFEHLTREPRVAVNSVLSWLGLSVLPDDVSFDRQNARPEAMVGVRGRGRLQRFRGNALWSALSPLVPRSVKTLGKRMAQQPVEFTTRHDAAVAEILRPWALESVGRLETLLGRDFPEWTTLATGDEG